MCIFENGNCENGVYLKTTNLTTEFIRKVFQ